VNEETRILVVDDNQGDIDLLREAFSENGFSPQIDTAMNGASAVEVLTAIGEGKRPRPRLVVLDLNLPIVHGREVLRFIKSNAQLRDLPTVMYSSSSRTSDIQQCRELGAEDYVVKPSSFTDLLTAAKALQAHCQ
jgi:CheY-like chemotaxis protein